jgi:DNA-binding NarL/FixJ family response regulator
VPFAAVPTAADENAVVWHGATVTGDPAELAAASDPRAFSVLFLEDEYAFRQSLTFWLEERTSFLLTNISVIEEVEPILDQVKPDIALIDLELDGRETGFTVPKIIKKRSPDTLCMVLTSAPDTALPEYVRRAMLSRGENVPFDGFATKRMSCDEIASAIYALAEEGVYIPLSLVPHLTEDGRNALTGQEINYLKAVRSGLKGPAIAKALKTRNGREPAKRTLDHYSESVRTKLHAKTLAEAVGIADERRLIPH